MALVDPEYARRRDTVIARARDLVRQDHDGFAAAGRKLEELFPSVREIHTVKPNEDGSVFVGDRCPLTRIYEAAVTAVGMGSDLNYYEFHFDFEANSTNEDRDLAARMVVLAFLLRTDPYANEVISPEICELGEIPWDSDNDFEPGRRWMNWEECDWSQWNEPSPRVLSLLERAIDRLRVRQDAPQGLITPRSDPLQDSREAREPEDHSDLRPAEWFSVATKEAIYPDLLRQAVHRKRLSRSQLVGRRWHHSMSEVEGLYPQYALLLKRARDREEEVQGVTKRNGA